MDASHKAPLLAWIKTWKTSGGAGAGYIKSAGEATAATMQEAWAYYAGSTGLSGRSYSGIKPAAGCQQNFVIFIGNSFSSAGSPGDGGSVSPASALAGAPGVTTAQQAIITTTHATSCGTYTFPTSAHESKGFYADEWARYMRQADIYSTIEGSQKITTYTIGLLGSSCQAEYAATLTSMANVGGGKYFATTDYTSITQALLKILNEVQAVNSVFSSSSLPVSVNAQGTYLNQIYMGMFRPDMSGFPRWLGNLKQYQFKYDVATDTLSLADKNGDGAISSAGTGFISPNAVSFWTTKNTAVEPDLGGGFWRNLP
jgi:type IV pilus assembly protein PilY1